MLDVEKFIQAVKERPALYCPTHLNYNRREIRMRLWNEIGQVMYPEWARLEEREKRLKALLLRKKWKSLKDSFSRELRQRKNLLHKPRKQYEFYDSLSFLLPKRNSNFAESFHEQVTIKTEPPQDEHINIQPINPPQDENINIQPINPPQPLHHLLNDPSHTQQQPPLIQIFQKTLCSQPDNQPRRQQLLQSPPKAQHRQMSRQTLILPKPSNVIVLQEPSLEDDQKKTKSCREEMMRPRQQRKSDRTDDSDRLFLMSFVNDMKKLPLSTKYWVKMKFSDIMHQATMNLDGMQEENVEEEEEGEEGEEGGEENEGMC